MSYLTPRLRRLLAAGSLLAASTIYASANPVVFTGSDLNAGYGDPHPNSAAAQTSFLTAAGGLGSVSTIDFESATVGAFTSLVVAPGVTMTSNGGGSVNNNFFNYSTSSLDGFNTTAGGKSYVEQTAGTVTFNFATPIQAFGAYISGVQLFFYNDVVTFSDGTSQSIGVPGVTDGSGALDYVAFTDAGKSISSISIHFSDPGQGGDFAGVDDVSYVSANAAPTPEPNSFALLLTGMGAVGAGYRRLRANRNA